MIYHSPEFRAIFLFSFATCSIDLEARKLIKLFLKISEDERIGKFKFPDKRNNLMTSLSVSQAKQTNRGYRRTCNT